jgi:hypothetical protein
MTDMMTMTMTELTDYLLEQYFIQLFMEAEQKV